MANQDDCPLCGHGMKSGDELALGACSDCARNLDLRPIPPSRRPPVPCQRCNQHVFVRALFRKPTFVSYDVDVDVQDAGPVTIQAPIPYTVAGTATRTVSRGEPRGVLEAYVCRGCGFVEWYCQDPTEIPIGNPHMTQLVDYKSDAPYR